MTYTIQDLAKAAKVSTRTIQRWVKRGVIPKPDSTRGPGAGKGSKAQWDERSLGLAEKMGRLHRVVETYNKEPQKLLAMM